MKSLGAVGQSLVGTPTQSNISPLDVRGDMQMAQVASLSKFDFVMPPGQGRSLTPEFEAEQKARRLREAVDAKEKLEQALREYAWLIQGTMAAEKYSRRCWMSVARPTPQTWRPQLLRQGTEHFEN